MRTLKFQVTLLSDVILNVKAATEGNNETLDFIPGSNFLGIVAGKYDELDSQGLAMEIFHSGKVRFGDAHPVQDEGTKRSLRVPASMYYPKLDDEANRRYFIHHVYDDKLDGEPLQLKQCRSGFYVFDDTQGTAVVTERSFAIKSAYDRLQRRALDEKMFGYESLDKGLQLLFSVEVDNDELCTIITQNLVGIKHVGRSRTAQYGLVKIEEFDFNETPSSQVLTGDTVTIYADGRLIFLDDNAMPTFRPTPKDLGIVDGDAKIDWSKSQVRTFQYAPWNFKRQTRDTDRCGIEKGSVFVVTGTSSSSGQSQYVGYYKNEGFGKVIYNPDFLAVKPDTNGEALYKLQKSESNKQVTDEKLEGTPLLNFVALRKQAEETRREIYEQVNEFVKKNAGKFKGDRFASQWGNIRSLAMTAKDDESLRQELWETEDGYLVHGVAKNKWKKYSRLKTLQEFAEKYKSGNLREAMINLASEMAKAIK